MPIPIHQQGQRKTFLCEDGRIFQLESLETKKRFADETFLSYAAAREAFFTNSLSWGEWEDI